MQDCGGAATVVGDMLITSAVAIFFSCSGATWFSEFEFDSVDDYLKLRNLILNDVAQQSGPQQVRQVRIYTTNGWGH